MTTNFLKSLIFLTIAILFFGFMYFYQIGTPSLFEEDEAKLAEISREIYLTNKWVDIQHNFAPNFHKPPMYNWATIPFFYMFGVNETSVRLPAAIFSLLTLIVTFLITALLFNQKIARLALIILGTSLQFLVLARIGLVDSMLTFFVSLTFLFFLYSYQKNQHYFLILTGLTTALAFLTKGPLGILLPWCTIILFLIFNKKINFLWRHFFLLFIAFFLFLVIGLPWWIAEYLIHGNNFLFGLFGQFMLGIYFNTFQKHNEPIYFYFFVILIGMLPWSICTLYGFFLNLKKEYRQQAGLLFSWVFVVFVLFTFAKTKIPSYIEPLFPALAILTANTIYHLYIIKKSKKIINFLLLLIVAIIFFILYFVLVKYVQIPSQIYQKPLLISSKLLFLFGIFSLISACLSLTNIKKYRVTLILTPLILIPLVFLVTAIHYFLPFYENFKPSKEVVINTKNDLKHIKNYHYYSFGNWRMSSLLFYLESKEPLIFLDKKEDISSLLLNKHEQNLIFMDLSQYTILKSELPEHKYISQKFDLITISNL